MSQQPPNRPDDIDTETAALLQIGSELSMIRMTLQQIHGEMQSESESNTDPQYQCRSCDAIIPDQAAAEQHVMNQHNAPSRDEWKNLMVEYER